MGFISFWKGDDESFNRIEQKLSDRLYFVLDTYKIYLGELELSNNNTTEIDKYINFASLAEISTVWDEDLNTNPPVVELPSNLFRFVIRTTRDAESVRVLANVGETIKWGDGTENTYDTKGTVEHIYETAGEYTLDYINDSGNPFVFEPYHQASQTIGIKAIGEISSTTLQFPSINNLEFVDCDLFKYNPQIKSIYGLFQGKSKLMSVSENIFNSAQNITSMSSVFYNCSKLTELPANMMKGCVAVTDLSNAFYGCGFTSIPQGFLDSCVEVVDAPFLFRQCLSLTTLPDGLFEYNTKLSNLTALFEGDANINHVYNCTLPTSPKLWERANISGNGFAQGTSSIFRSEIPGSWGGLK